jgi:hypothetical protein
LINFYFLISSSLQFEFQFWKKNQDFEPTVWVPNNQTKNWNQPKTETDEHWYRTQGFISNIKMVLNTITYILCHMSVNKHRHAHNRTKPYYDSDGWSYTKAYEWRAETPSFEVETSNVTALQIGHSMLLVTAILS